MNKKILVTGGTSHLASDLKKYIPYAYFLNGRKELDLSNYNDVYEFFSRHSPDWVIHTASVVGGIKSNMNNPFGYLYDNILLNTNVFRACKELNIERFTSILSTCVYPSNNVDYPIKEENIIKGDPEPTNRGYAQSKRILAELIDLSNSQNGTKFNYIIPCNLFGKEPSYDPDKTHFLTSLIYKSAKNMKSGIFDIEMFGSGNVLRQFVTYDELAFVISEMVHNDVTESFNFSPDWNLSLKDYGKIIEKISDNKISVSFNGNGPDGIFRKDADNSRMKKLFPNFEFKDIEDTIKDVFNFYLSNDNI